MAAGKIFEGIVYLLPTGCQRNVLQVPVLYTLISFAGRKVVFWLLFGQLDWLNMIKWRVSPGNGQASTEPL